MDILPQMRPLSKNFLISKYFRNTENNKQNNYTQAVLKFTKLITEAQQRDAITQGRSLPPIPATVYIS
jgi:hypothetical protein